MSYMSCCGARMNMEGLHKPDCDGLAEHIIEEQHAQAQYEADLAVEHAREERVQYEREDQHNDRVREWVEETYPGDVRNIPGGY